MEEGHNEDNTCIIEGKGGGGKDDIATEKGKEEQQLLLTEDFTRQENDESVKENYLSRSYLQRKRDQIKDEGEKRKLSGKLRSFYKEQDKILAYIFDGKEEDALDATTLQAVNRAAKISLLANLLLLFAKAVAAGLSDSLAIVSSVVDSAVDLVSGTVLWYAARRMKEADIDHYPQGRSRLEPISIVILSCIMAMASVILIREAIENMVKRAVDPDISIPTLAIIGATILIKLMLFLYCRRYRASPSVQALAEDHRNDVLSNAFAAIFGALGKYVWVYADPIGAMLISIYIFFNWWRTGSEQIKALTGRAAPQHIIQKITWECLNHDDKIVSLDTVRAYSFGTNYLVEVDIVLNENITLREAHDIGEPLQRRIESLPEIERAFVHLDYEVSHRAIDEHKQVWDMYKKDESLVFK